MKLITLATLIQWTRCFRSGSLERCAGVLSYLGWFGLGSPDLHNLQDCDVDSCCGLHTSGDADHLPLNMPLLDSSDGNLRKSFISGLSRMEQALVDAIEITVTQMIKPLFEQLTEQLFKFIRSGQYRLRPNPLT